MVWKLEGESGFCVISAAVPLAHSADLGAVRLSTVKQKEPALFGYWGRGLLVTGLSGVGPLFLLAGSIPTAEL